jgi:hypothetical protein
MPTTIFTAGSTLDTTLTAVAIYTDTTSQGVADLLGLLGFGGGDGDGVSRGRRRDTRLNNSLRGNRHW